MNRNHEDPPGLWWMFGSWLKEEKKKLETCLWRTDWWIWLRSSLGYVRVVDLWSLDSILVWYSRLLLLVNVVDAFHKPTPLSTILLVVFYLSLVLVWFIWRSGNGGADCGPAAGWVVLISSSSELIQISSQIWISNKLNLLKSMLN